MTIFAQKWEKLGFIVRVKASVRLELLSIFVAIAYQQLLVNRLIVVNRPMHQSITSLTR